MALTTGTRFGPYEVIASLGAGGMGEVYRATDTNLKRAVALKVLPASLAADADRLARFQREAEVLASLNHPHIAAIHSLERRGATIALVMELVEGEDLSRRIARGAMSLDEALPIATQIAEALEAAHDQGIIHRDLKPANIKVRPDGWVKVLDFGLAKALGAESANATAGDIGNSPTLTSPAMMTRAGVILGTAAYMSPEQARGQAVDKRTDIWAFGCVLYEMVTGVSPFSRATVTDTLAAVVGREPDWTLLPMDISKDVRPLLQRCLDKDRQRRLRDIGEARLALEAAAREAAENGSSTNRPVGDRTRPTAEPRHGSATRWRRLAAGIVAATVLTLGVTAWRVWPSATGGAEPQIRSLAVLPLRSLMENPAENYIGLGVADSIIMAVSRARTLAVRPTSAVRAYAAANTDALTAARQLGVDAVLDGTWYRDGERLRVAVNLLRVSDGVSMWTESRDVRAGDMFAIQDQLADQIASRLRVELAPLRARRGTENAEAYDLYAKGRFYFGQRGFTAEARGNSDTATNLFEQAVRVDPAFAEAHAMLGFAYAWTAIFMEENLSLIARAEAETALAERLNAGLGQIHLTRGFMLFSWYRGWRMLDAIHENRRAGELDPGLSDLELGALLYHVGLFDEWEAANLRAIERDPTNQPLKRVFVNEFYLVNRPEDGLAMQRRLFGQDQAPDVRHFLYTRRLREAEPLVEAVVARTPNDVTALMNLALLRALQGRHAEAEALVPRLLSTLPRNRAYHHGTYTIARVFALGGKVDEAARWLNETIDSGFPCYPMMVSDTFLDPIRNAPEIRTVLARLRSQYDDFRAAMAVPQSAP